MSESFERRQREHGSVEKVSTAILTHRIKRFARKLGSTVQSFVLFSGIAWNRQLAITIAEMCYSSLRTFQIISHLRATGDRAALLKITEQT